ncbi:MAG: site-specific DNA-methyltransferase [Comamonas sp.]|jgi:DNA modification methylase|uniref:DNA-methyltransferase n=1 Tax=Comamonas sp. TaxID=34028 RepID=UPI00282D8EB6|nr:site-specific DNA-methyltransferase [Comamonas sp.]MDR0216129.1 site-specific DNA-methyltransferase [Comamonas sp.]
MNTIEFGDCREIMRRWASDGVRAQMCVTSPPYFGLRDYGHAGQLGLEQTPEQYVQNMVEVFRCVRDMLANDGTLWLNIGDSYARTGGTDRKVSESAQVGSTRNTLEQMGDRTSNAAAMGLKSKDLIGIPWMLAFALRADGWHLRQDIIWHKPNPMPESVRDRCTKAHEYVFLLSKSERYFFDSEAMKEDAVRGHAGSDFRKGKTAIHQENRISQAERVDDGKRNRRSVWTVATRPYKGAHFATFPPTLIEPCILAGSMPGQIVLDPFMGSGTSAAVALQHGRQYLGCELNPDYEPLQCERIQTLDDRPPARPNRRQDHPAIQEPAQRGLFSF